MRNGAFPTTSINKDVTVTSDPSLPGQVGKRTTPAIWYCRQYLLAAATPCGEHWGKIPFNNVLARVFSLFWLDGWGQLGWTVQLQKSPLRRSMDCFLLFYTKHIPHKLPMVSSLQLVLFWCGGVNHCSPFFMPSLYLDYTSTLFALWLRFLPLEVECISSLN